MPNFFWIGIVKNDNVTNGGSISFGQNVFQNRTATKQNNGSFAIGDGINPLPILAHVNQDPDLADNLSADAQDFNNSPQV